ncbi:GntR family transcriptional regulator [Sphingobium yanoikuyae]
MERRFRPGARLEPGELAAIPSASTTPVSEALNHLAGAGLVESRTGSGFHLRGRPAGPLHALGRETAPRPPWARFAPSC